MLKYNRSSKKRQKKNRSFDDHKIKFALKLKFRISTFKNLNFNSYVTLYEQPSHGGIEIPS
ncbi:hypothetical protein BpHYR1_034156 [Brachionus plicatilis]|uniref:Uncharacterized protein n=1 Tax=Brachionus plicatilis TaxID=10195 RepID=A0A3M7S682_BRAPC|nr:hypothetical protein BpHYR1_034156 [Brachionus plicatilis]